MYASREHWRLLFWHGGMAGERKALEQRPHERNIFGSVATEFPRFPSFLFGRPERFRDRGHGTRRLSVGPSAKMPLAQLEVPSSPYHTNGTAVRNLVRTERIFCSSECTKPSFETLVTAYHRPPKRVAEAAVEENAPSNPTPELVRRQYKLAKTEAEALSLAASIAVAHQLARESEAPCTLSEGQRRALAAALAGKTGMGVNLTAVTGLGLQLDCSFTKASCEEAAPRLAHLLRRATKLTSLDCRSDCASPEHALDLLEPILQAATQDLEELFLPASVSSAISAARQRLAAVLLRFGRLKKIHLGHGWGAVEWIETVVPHGCSIVSECL